MNKLLIFLCTIKYEVINFLNARLKLRGKCSNCHMYFVKHIPNGWECECCGDLNIID